MGCIEVRKKPMITGKEWIKIQKLLELNKPKNYHKPKNNTSLLSGILVCGHCGSYMRPKANRRLDENGNKTYSYLCETKEKSRRHLKYHKSTREQIPFCEGFGMGETFWLNNEDRKIP